MHLGTPHANPDPQELMAQRPDSPRSSNSACQAMRWLSVLPATVQGLQTVVSMCWVGGSQLKGRIYPYKKAPKSLPHLWEHNPQKKTTFQQITFSLLWGIQSKQAPQIQSDFSSPTELDSFINWDINAANTSLCLYFPKNTQSVLSRWEQQLQHSSCLYGCCASGPCSAPSPSVHPSISLSTAMQSSVPLQKPLPFHREDTG